MYILYICTCIHVSNIYTLIQSYHMYTQTVHVFMYVCSGNLCNKYSYYVCVYVQYAICMYVCNIWVHMCVWVQHTYVWVVLYIGGLMYTGWPYVWVVLCMGGLVYRWSCV